MTPREPTDLPGSRQRLIDAASRLLTRQGYEATVVKEIARDGGAPMGSFYFHFPGGKEELGVIALQHGAERFGELLRTTLTAADALEDALAGCATTAADLLEQSDWLDGCPVAATALESVSRSAPLRTAAAQAFTGWQDIIRDRVSAAGVGEPEASTLASSVLALLEGAELLARVEGHRRPLDQAAHSMRVLATAALPVHPAERA